MWFQRAATETTLDWSSWASWIDTALVECRRWRRRSLIRLDVTHESHRIPVGIGDDGEACSPEGVARRLLTWIPTRREVFVEPVDLRPGLDSEHEHDPGAAGPA